MPTWDIKKYAPILPTAITFQQTKNFMLYLNRRLGAFRASIDINVCTILYVAKIEYNRLFEWDI